MCQSIEDATAVLTAAGYRVTKPRPRKASAIDEQCEHVQAGEPVARIVGIGRKSTYRGRSLCAACFAGPSSLRPMKDPERYARVFRVWRKAHHLYHHTIRIEVPRYSGYDVRDVRITQHPRLAALVKALQSAGGQVAA